MPVVPPNTLSQIADTAMLHEYKEDYKRELLPQQLGVGAKFAAELLAIDGNKDDTARYAERHIDQHRLEERLRCN